MRASLSSKLMALLAAVGVAACAFADVRVEVSPRQGALDETFVFSVIVDSPADVNAPVLGRSEDFGVSYIGPQSSVSIINGDVRKQVAYNYRLIPRRIGSLQTPAVDVEVGGEILHANPVEVKVSNEPPAARTQKVSGVTLKQSIDPKTAYVGQQVNSTLELQTALNLIEPQFVDLSFDGFWVETIADNERSSRISGHDQYDILRFRKALYALTSGTLIIPPRKLRAQVRDTRRNRPFPFDSFNPFSSDMLDDFFGGGPVKPIAVESNGLSVEVKELPPAPPGFSSAGMITPLVGETTISVRIAEGSLKVGETKTLEVTVTSTGNLNPLKSIPLKTPSTVKTYEDAPETKNFESGGVLMSRKLFRVSVVPLQGGNITIPPVEIGYFDTTEDSYRVARSQEIVLAVEGEAGQAPIPRSAPSRQVDPAPTKAVESSPLQPPALEVAYREQTGFEKFREKVSTSMLLLILAALGTVFMVVKKIGAIRSTTAPARRGLAQITEATNVAELSVALRSYVSMKLGLGNSDLRGEQFRVVAERQIKNRDARFALQAVLDALDAALYAPESKSDVDSLRERALAVARAL